MMHLMTFIGKSAKKFYLNPQCISDFKSLMRTVTSGRVMIISTKFRSDLFYVSGKSKKNSILKLWAFYANISLDSLDGKDFTSTIGDKKSLSIYFEGINILATNSYYYRNYKNEFHDTFSSDHQNPIAKTIVQCDQYLIDHTGVKRTPLVTSKGEITSVLMKNTLSLAMSIANNQTLSN
jgi:hypothetical protein